MASPLGTLIKLPPELRIQIYSLVLDSPEPNRYGFPTREIQIDPISYENTKHMTLSPALFLTSRAIASETIPLYLSSHKFTIRLASDPRGVLLGWLQHAVGTDYWHNLQGIFLWYPAEYDVWKRSMAVSQSVEVLFWSHREIMMVYRADRAQKLAFDVFSRPLNSSLARLVSDYGKEMVDLGEPTRKILDWLWVDAMRLGRQFMLEGTDDLMVVSRFGKWTREMLRAIKKREGFLELLVKERTGWMKVVVT